MKWRLASLAPALIGAMAGGIYPGSFFAFILAASMASGQAGETVCFVLTLAFSVAGVALGFLLFEGCFPNKLRRVDVKLGLALGVLFGIAGYFFCDWMIANADPPL